jgi:hypothetical protein
MSSYRRTTFRITGPALALSNMNNLFNRVIRNLFLGNMPDTARRNTSPVPYNESVRRGRGGRGGGYLVGDQVLQRDDFQLSWSAAVSVIHLVLGLGSGHQEILGVRHDDIVPAVGYSQFWDMWEDTCGIVDGFVLPHE